MEDENILKCANFCLKLNTVETFFDQMVDQYTFKECLNEKLKDMDLNMHIK
jgi:hypothetical protein